MTAYDYIRMLPALRARIYEAETQIKDFIYVGSPDSTQPAVTGGLPGNATAVKALRMADLHEHIARNEDMIKIIESTVNKYLDFLSYGQRSAVVVKYMTPAGLLPDKIKSVYGRNVSTSKYYKDLKAGTDALKKIEIE